MYIVRTTCSQIKHGGLRIACAQINRGDYSVNTEKMRSIQHELRPHRPDLIVFPEKLDTDVAKPELRSARFSRLYELCRFYSASVAFCDYDGPLPRADSTNWDYMCVITPPESQLLYRFSKGFYALERRVFSLKDYSILGLMSNEAPELCSAIREGNVRIPFKNVDLVVVPSCVGYGRAAACAQEIFDTIGKPNIVLNPAGEEHDGGSVLIDNNGYITKLSAKEQALIIEI